MNFLRGVMGGQSAGPQHTEAETVRERRVWDLGRVRAGTETEDSGVRRSPPAPHRGSTCCLPLCLPFSPETSGLLLPYVPSAVPTTAARPCRLQPRPEAPQARRGGWSVDGTAREGIYPGQRWPDQSPTSVEATGLSLFPFSTGREESEVLLPLSRSGMGLWGRLGLNPSCL